MPSGSEEDANGRLMLPPWRKVPAIPRVTAGAIPSRTEQTDCPAKHPTPRARRRPLTGKQIRVFGLQCPRPRPMGDFHTHGGLSATLGPCSKPCGPSQRKRAVTETSDRVRTWRKRKQAGRVVLAIEVDFLRTSDWLVDQGLLAAWDADDREKVRVALEFAVAALCARGEEA